MALRDDSGDVERLFAVLVETLSTRGDTGRLRRPLQVSEIYQEIVPYRACRDRLGIDANQDYEMAVLRLLAGEGGFAAIQPEEARTLLADEVAAPSPDPTLVREYAAAHVLLDPAAVQRVLGRERAYGPETVEQAEEVKEVQEAEASPPQIRPSVPAFALEPDDLATPPDESAPTPRASAPVVQGGLCKACGRTLPLHREVVYCPFCGQQAGTRRCRECGEPLEPGWRFCVTCGTEPAR